MRLAFAAALCCGLAVPQMAGAQQNFRSVCQIRALCPDMQPGGGRAIACLREHKAQLSVACKLAIADFFLNRQGRGGGGEGGGRRGLGPDAPDGPGDGGGRGGGPDGPRGGGGGPERPDGPGRGGPDGPGDGGGPDGPGAGGPDGPDQGPPPR